MLTHHVLWMKEAIKQTSCCDVIIHFRIFSWSQVWICIKHQYFWRGEISFLYSLYDEDNFKLAIFFFWKWENSKKISNHCIILNKGIDISSQKTFLCTLPQASVNNSVNELNVLCVHTQLRGNQELIQLWVHYVLYLQRIKLYSLHDYFMEWVSGVFIHAAPDARAITQWSSPARVLRLAKFEESTWKGWPSSHRT